MLGSGVRIVAVPVYSCQEKRTSTGAITVYLWNELVPMRGRGAVFPPLLAHVCRRKGKSASQTELQCGPLDAESAVYIGTCRGMILV